MMIIKMIYYSLLFPVTPSITTWAKSVTVRAGDTLVLICSAQGNPQPTVYWRREATRKVKRASRMIK